MSTFWIIIIAIGIGSLYSWLNRKLSAWKQEWEPQQEEPTPTHPEGQYFPYQGVESHLDRSYSTLDQVRSTIEYAPSVESDQPLELTILEDEEDGTSAVTLFDKEESERERIRFLRRAIIMKEVLERKL